MSDTEEQITDEEKAQIAQDFINHAPPGEVDDVIRDVRILLNDDNNFRDGIVEALSKYQQTQFMPVEVGDDKQVLLTSHGYLDNGRFLDPHTNKSFRFDFNSKSCGDEEQLAEVDAACEAYRSAVSEQLKPYVAEFYPAGVTTVYGKRDDNGDVLVIACIEDHKYSPENFWNGKWRSEWKITVTGSSATIAGVLKTQVHYYEDGNVQLVSQKDCKDNLSVTSEKQLGECVRKTVEKFEHEYQTGVFENYGKMSTSTFKALRRQLPVTRTKIDWNKILGYQIGKQIGGK